MAELDDFSNMNWDDFDPDGSSDTMTDESTGGDDHHGLPNGAALAVIDSDQAVREYLASQVGEGVAMMESLSELEPRLGMGPVVVVLGPSCADPTDLAIVERWSRTNPEVGSVLVTSELTTSLLQTALRAGVKDVVSAPIDQMQLVDTIARVAEGLSSNRSVGPVSGGVVGTELIEAFDGEPGKVISIFSTKGGSGKSVTATNLACALSRISDRPVALLDGHLQFGDVAVMLKLQPRHTIVDAVSQIEKLDASLLQQLMTVHESSGLMVLPAPTEPTFADQVTAEQMGTLISMLKTFCGHVIIDMPAIFNEVVISMLEVSDDIVLVAGLDIPNIKNVKIGLSTLSLLNIPKERLHLVLNRADSRVKLDVGEVERTLQIDAVAHVPSDVVVPISVNKGSPVVISAAKSSVAREFEQLALRFIDGEVAPAAEASQSFRQRFLK